MRPKQYTSLSKYNKTAFMLLFPYPELHDSWQCCFGLALFAGTENNMLSLRLNLATGVAVNFYGNWKIPTSTQNNIPAKVRANPPKANNQNRERERGDQLLGSTSRNLVCPKPI